MATKSSFKIQRLRQLPEGASTEQIQTFMQQTKAALMSRRVDHFLREDPGPAVLLDDAKFADWSEKAGCIWGVITDASPYSYTQQYMELLPPFEASEYTDDAVKAKAIEAKSDGRETTVEVTDTKKYKITRRLPFPSPKTL
jgi:hypothetical protein